MTKEEKYNLAEWAISFALKNGAQQASVSISESRNSNIEVRGEKTDTLEQAIQRSLLIRIYADNRYSAFSTNRLKKNDLKSFIKEAVVTTRFLSEDKYRTLPAPELYYKGEPQNLQTADENYNKLSPKEKINLAFQVEKEVIGKDPRIISVTAGYHDGYNENIMVTSNGFAGDTVNSYFGLSANVSVMGGNARPESGWGETAVFFDKLKKTEIGKEALERALKKIGQKKTASGKMSMIVENRIVPRLFSPMMSALNGSAIQQKNSFLTDKLGEKVISDKLTVRDNPFIVSGRASRMFDNEGLATKKRVVFEKGVLRNYYINTYYGKKLGMKPTGGNNSNLVFETGEKTLQELIGQTERGILVTGFNGGNCNGATGDFSYGIEGFLIEKGEIVQPVSEMNVTGNMLELWSNIAELGNDVNRNSSWLIPSVFFSEADFSGA